MDIQFIYVQIKENLEEYIVAYKKETSSEDINKLIYNNLYNEDTIYNSDKNDINYIKLFYVKKGLTIPYEQNIWDKLLHIRFSNLDIKVLIDEKKLTHINKSNCLHFNYKNNKNQIDKLIIDSFLLKN